MAKGFNLTAEINLRGPSNIRQVVGGIRKQLQGVNTSLNININKKNIQGISQANSRLAAINKTLQTTTKNAKNATTAFNKLSTSMRNVANVKIPNNISSGMNTATKSIQTSTKAVRQAKNEFEEFGKLGGLAIKRFAAFSVVTGAIYSVNNAIASGVKEFLEYDRQLTRVSQVLNVNRESLKGLDKTITQLSTSLGVSSSELANVTVTLSQAGIQAADTRKALDALAKSALAPTFTSLTNTTEGAIAAMRQFSITAGQLEGALGSINAVAGSFAVEAGDIITAIQRTGGVFASASKGVSQGTDALNEFIAVFTSVRATSRESAETIATGLRTIFTRIQRKDTIESLKAFGITLTDLEGKFVGPYKAIQLLSDGLKSLDTRDLRFAGIAEQLGGFRQIGKVIPLIQQFGTAQNALNVAQQGSSSLARDAAKGQLALAVQIQKVREEFTALVRSISDSTGFRNLLSLGLDLATVFVRVADSLKGLLPLIAGLGAVKGLSALTGFTKGFGGVFKKADGGYIHKFARGGVVPGTGSGDTVPAMLQPGEFVIRKKAVETLGTKRLHKMNKFSNGKFVGKSKRGIIDPKKTKVTDVVDGDTIGGDVFTNMTFRFGGVDAPEVSEPLGAKATKSLMARGFERLTKSVRSTTGGKSRGIFRDDEIATSMISKGLAVPDKRYTKKLFDTTADAAFNAQNPQGLWADPTHPKHQQYVKQYNKQKKEEKALGGYIQALAKGGDVVPAMLTPGEFVINKKSASQIGSRALHSLNRADKIKGYNSGGFVGFKNGGGVPARPGTTMGTIGITQADVGMLDEIGNAIKELGISSSSSADLIAQGSQVSYEAAMGALEADKMRADAIGANTDAIDASIKSLQNQGKKILKVSQALEGSSGGDLEKLSGRLNRGQDAGKASKSLRTKEGGALNNLIRSGEADAASVKEYIAGARRDRKTLNEMDSRYVNQRKRHLSAQGSSDKEASKLAEQEVRLRRKAVDDNAKSIGAKGPGDFGKRIGEFSSKIGLGIGLMGSVLSNLSEAQNASEAARQAALSSGTATFGAGQVATGAIVDLLPTDKLKSFAGGLGLAGSAILGAGQAFISAQNAARQFNIDEAFKKSENALESAAKSFEDLAKDTQNIAIRETLEQKISDAGDALAKGLKIQNDTAKLFWANAIDVVRSGGSEKSVQRSQILEAQGFFAYLRSSFDEQFRTNNAAIIAQSNVSAQAAQFKPVADSIVKLIEEEFKAGVDLDDILDGGNFNNFARSLSMADVAINSQITAIRNSTEFSEREKTERIKHIQSITAEEKIRSQYAVLARQKEIEALQQSTNIYVRSLERMFTNMEHSIGATDAALNSMNRQIELTTASLQGQARIGEVILDSIAVLQNPRAFSAGDRSSARASAGTIFGSSGEDIAGLINLGESLETSVIASLNNALAAGETDSTVIGQKLSDSVRASLANVGLPQDLSARIAKQANEGIQAAIKDSGDDIAGIDFGTLSDKLSNLSSVVESSKKAREVAIKALEAYNNVLNNYTKNLNKIVDVEISSRNYARKAVDLLADSEIDLAKALGKTINVIDIINNREGQVRRQTGGPTSPTDIFNNINRLEGQRRNQQATVDSTSQIAGRETDQFIKFNNELKNTSISLRENISALKDMANNTDVAAAALNKIQEAQQTNAQKIGFFEKVVTSTPEELENMQRSFVRLQNNINGNVNTINNSMGAQKAYHDALRDGASGFDAMRAAQGAFAKERGETLGLMKSILPFLGDSEQAGGIKANVLESMLRESGIGVNPMMQQVLNSLKNPATDPAVAASIQQYKQANALQVEANRLLGRLESDLASDLAAKNEQGLKNALNSITIDFESAQLNDINNGVNTIIQIMQQEKDKGGADNFARGGVVYAAGGQQIFKPKGTDTVPAMLTPGEFVVNKKSAQANMPLLKNINSGYYAAGGLVTNFGNVGSTKGVGDTEPLLNLNTFKKITEDLNANALAHYSLGRRAVAEPSSSISTQTFARDQREITGPPYDLENLRSYNIMSLDNTPSTMTIGAGPIIDAALTNVYGMYGAGSTKRPKGYMDTPERAVHDQPGWKNPFANVLPSTLDMSQPSLSVDNDNAIKQYTDLVAAYKNSAMGGISSIDSSNFYLDDLQSLPRNPYSVSSINPNQIAPGILGLSKTAPILQDKPWGGYKIWEDQSFSTKAIGAISINEPNYNRGTFLDKHPFAVDPSPANRVLANTPIAGPDLNTLLTKHNENEGTVNDLVSKWDVRGGTRANGIPNNVAIGAEGERRNSLYAKLQDLISNEATKLIDITPAELTQLDARPDPDIGKLRSLYLADTTSSFGTIIKQKAKAIKQLVDAGSGMPPGFENAKFGVEGLGKVPGKIFPNLFNITDPALMMMNMDYNWVGNVTAKDLGKQFEAELEKAKSQNTDGTNTIKLIRDNIKGKFPLPANNPLGLDSLDFDIPVAYEKYIGKFYDGTLNAFNDDISGFLPFSTDTNLFKNVDPNEFSRIALKKKLGIADIAAGIDPNTLDPSNLWQYYSALLGGEDDAVLKDNISKASLSLGPTWNKFFGGASPIPRFTGLGPDKQTFQVGDLIIAQMEKMVKGAGADGDKIDTTSSAFQNSNLEDSLLPTATKSLTKSALEIFQQKQFTRGLSGFLGRNIGIVPRMDIEDSNEAKSVAGFVSNIFSTVGGYADSAFQQAPNDRVAQFIKDAYILASGAWQAFGGIRDGDTNLLNDFNTAANAKGEIPKAYAEGLFRSLGGGAALAQIMDLSLPGEYSALLDGKQLEGSKIAKIGADGSIKREDMVNAIPDDVSGLIDLIFNPYNEFKGQLRGKLLEQFQTDLRNLKGGRGLPFFDANTQGFIDKGVDALQFYYGGDGKNWKGLDHLYDGKPENMSSRGQNLLSNFADSGFDEASAVNAAFGINNKFGPLPGRTFIQGRSMKQVEQQNRANGGMIYAQNGQLVNFQPQGTDTVPAMLTPGEFVINRQATQANLPLLKAINSGERLVPPGFDAGGKVFDDMVTVTSKNELDNQMGSLVENMKKYTSGEQGHEKLIHFAQRGLGVASAGLGDTKGYGAYAQFDSRGVGKLTFSKERMSGATVRHEYAHAFAHSGHDQLLKPLVNQDLLKEVSSSNYREAGSTSYTIGDFARQPAELFATLASIKGGIGPKSSQFLRSSFKALGYQNGGLVGGTPTMAGQTGKFVSNDGKEIMAKLLATGNGTVKMLYNSKEYEVPYERFDAATRASLERTRRNGIIAGSMKRGEGGESAVRRIQESNKLEEVLTNDQAIKKYAPNGIRFMQRDIGNPAKWSPYSTEELQYRESKGRQAWYTDPNFDPSGVGPEARGNYLPYSTEMKRPPYRKIYDVNGNLLGTGYVARTSDKTATLRMNDGTNMTIPLNRLSSADKKNAEKRQSWSDHMSNTGDLGMSGRPTGQMLPVPKHFLNWEHNPRMFSNAQGTMKKEGRILKVGPNGVMMESLAGSNRGQSGFVAYDELDSASRGIAYELHQSAQNNQKVQSRRDSRNLRDRTVKLFPMGVTDRQFNAMNNSMTDGELREVYNSIKDKVQAERQKEKQVAAGERERKIGESVVNRINDPSKREQNALDINIAKRYLAQFQNTKLPAGKLREWLDENTPGISGFRRNLVLELQRGALNDQLNAAGADIPTPVGRRETPTSNKRAADLKARQEKAIAARKARLNQMYKKFVERYGKDKARAIMEQKGYKAPQYLSEGGGVKDLVTAAGSALQNVGTSRGNPFTARNIGYGMGGHTGALIGEAGEIIGEGLYHGAQHGMKAGMTSAAAGYGAMVAADFVGEATSLALDPEAAGKRYESANRRQANQGYLSNVGENLINPGRAIMQIGKETAGLMGDLTSVLRPGYKRPTDSSPGRRAQRRQFGGVIYAANGMMVPRGTDTVPAMLTPGEFVVNRSAAQANMPLLNSINNGTQYLEKGGAVGSNANFEAFSNVLKTVTDSLNLFNAALIQGSGSEGNAGGEAGGVNTNGIAAFTQNLSSLLSQLEKINIPDSMNVSVGGTVNVNVAGGEAFANLAQQSINSVVHQKLSAALDIVEKETEGQIKNPLK